MFRQLSTDGWGRYYRAMSTQDNRPAQTDGAIGRAKTRPWFLAVVLGVAALIGWGAWPSDQGIAPFELSRLDGKPRFFITTYSKGEGPSNLTLSQRLDVALWEYKRRYGKPNPAAYTFPASPVQSCSIQGWLNQCMSVGGTKYFIAVEILGASVPFGNTNALNGAQWVAAFEQAIESNRVSCHDFTQKRSYQDSVLLIRERPGQIKVVPRSKLSEYQKAGLVKADAR